MLLIFFDGINFDFDGMEFVFEQRVLFRVVSLFDLRPHVFVPPGWGKSQNLEHLRFFFIFALKCFDTLIKECFKVNYFTRHSFWCKNFQNRSENKKVMGNLMRKILMEWTAAILFICCGYTKFKNQLQSLVLL